METKVLIVGAGPSGLATSACLSVKNIPHIVLEREDCYASLWQKRTYDRVNLHLAKEFCSLPYKPHSEKSPTFLSKKEFLQYLEDYVMSFDIKPKYHRSVESAVYENGIKRWRVTARNSQSGDLEVYTAEFLVVASGENNEGYIPNFSGLDGFKGDVLHSSQYKCGKNYQGKEVLVVGCGNSGMEIAYDLSNYGANASIVIRNPVHVLTKEMVHLGMTLLGNNFSVSKVDDIVTLMAKAIYGDLSQYGIHPPREGPFATKNTTGRSPVIDVGTIKKIVHEEIKVVSAISKIKEDSVTFENGDERKFDAIVFATGYKSVANKWLKDYEYVLNENSMPKNSVPLHWKGEKKVYCAGLSRRGIFGVSMDAMEIAEDIMREYRG